MKPCPNCQMETRQVKAGKTGAGSQRYKCQHCGSRYLLKPKARGYPEALRLQAIRLYVDGMNYRRIARHLKVHHTSVINWTKAFAAQLPDAPLPEEIRTIELDELFTFIGTKKSGSTSSQR
ncbi:MAG: IS1 family transposase [Anaerolineae bacterium]|nr:MAG: IS1 family transposase [Anaerolineae bacterium]